MRAVNLLPKDAGRGSKGLTREDPAVVVGAALGAVVLIALLGGFMNVHSKVNKAQHELIKAFALYRHSFDPGARFQCRKPITERIPKKEVRNECALFEARKTVERETTTAVAEVKDARSAFDKLFK